jgi:protein SCO1/2
MVVPRVRAPHAAALLLTGLLTGCSVPAPDWHASRLPADFPALELELKSASGHRLDETRLAGTYVLLMFGYLSCPDVCPSTLARLRAALSALPPAVARRFRVVFVSVDPERDSPARLARYTGAFGEHFIGTTAGVPSLRRLMQRYGLSFGYSERSRGAAYTVSHPGGVFAFDAGGEARLLIDQGLSVEAIASDLHRLATGAGA